MPDNRRHPAQYLSVTVLKWPLESGRWATRNCPMVAKAKRVDEHSPTIRKADTASLRERYKAWGATDADVREE